MAINSVTNVQVQKTLKKQEAAEATTTQAASDTLTFKGQSNATKEQNTRAFNGLDSKAQEIISSHFVKASWTAEGGYGDMSKMAADLNKNGYTAKVGSSSDINAAGGMKGQKVRYLEITDKNGKTVRLWDANGDGGFGKADMNLAGALNNFKNDIANRAADAKNATTALNNNDNDKKVGNNQQSNVNPYKNYLDYLIRTLKDILTTLDVQDENQNLQQRNIEFELNALQQQYDAL